MAEIGVKMAFKQGVPPFPARLPLHHTKAMQDVLDRQNIVLDIEKVVPWNSVLPERAVPRVKERKLKLGEIACTEYAYGKEAANKKTVLAAGYENLSYELAKKEIYRGCSVHAGGEKYVLRGIGNSRQLAEMLVAAGETLDDHATLPVGFVENESGEQLLICQTGRMRSLDLMVGRSSRGRHEAARIIIGKLARLHSAGLGLEGGATPGKYGINPAGDVKIFNPANVYALGEDDSRVHELILSIAKMINEGAVRASRKEIGKLVLHYCNEDGPVAREEVRKYAGERKVKYKEPHLAVVEAALRFCSFHVPEEKKYAGESAKIGSVCWNDGWKRKSGRNRAF